MADFAAMTLTAAGHAIQTQAQAGAALNFTRIAIGDGVAPVDTAALTALVNETRSVQPSSLDVIELGQVRLRSVFNNENLLVSLIVRELGVFAIDPADATEKLYSYTNAGEGYDTIPPAGGTSLSEQVYDIHTFIGTAADVSANLASNVYASADHLADHITQVEAALAAQLALIAANTNHRIKGTLS